MSWEIFETAPSHYESCYRTPYGQRTDRAERALLQTLLAGFPSARQVLEVGCGTGHFTTWLACQGVHVVGFDRSPTMVTELHRQTPTLPVILGDAHHLPFRTHAVDVIAFVTTLEFLDQVEIALEEAVRVARQGIIMVVLNRWSLGGLSRRWGAQARGSLLGQARDYSVGSLRTLVKHAGGKRVRKIRWSSTLFPNGLWWLQAPLPVGEVLGMAAVLGEREQGHVQEHTIRIRSLM
jgi:SAM-dependent methyltransferase